MRFKARPVKYKIYGLLNMHWPLSEIEIGGKKLVLSWDFI